MINLLTRGLSALCFDAKILGSIPVFKQIDYSIKKYVVRISTFLKKTVGYFFLNLCYKFWRFTSTRLIESKITLT